MMFEHQIENLVQTLLHNRARATTLSPFWYALGCVHASPAGWRNFNFVTPPQPVAEHETLVVETLIYALHSQQLLFTSEPPDNNASLLDGLLRQERWRFCLNSQATAIAFATSLTEFWESRPKSTAGSILLREVSGQVCAVLNAWLKPAVPFSGDPLDGPASTYNVARAMFGDAWCAIALSGLTNDQHWKIPELIREQRPPFLPGLLPTDRSLEHESLPLLEMP